MEGVVWGNQVDLKGEERQWDGSGMAAEWLWNGHGMVMEGKWNGNGMEMEW